MGCCKDHSGTSGKPIPQLAGELKIVHEDNSLTNVSLDGKDLWCLKALLTNAEKLGSEFANAEGRALIMALKLRMFGADEPVKSAEGCGVEGCGRPGCTR